MGALAYQACSMNRSARKGFVDLYATNESVGTMLSASQWGKMNVFQWKCSETAAALVSNKVTDVMVCFYFYVLVSKYMYPHITCFLLF